MMSKRQREMTDVKAGKVKLTLTPGEMRIMRKIMILFRNAVLAEGKPTEDVDRLILKLS